MQYNLSALRGCCAMKFLNVLEIDQGYLEHAPTGTGPRPKKINREHVKMSARFLITFDFDLEYPRNRSTYSTSFNINWDGGSPQTF